MNLLLLVLCILAASMTATSCNGDYPERLSVTSPDGSIRLEFDAGGDTLPTYRIYVDTIELISPSALGMSLTRFVSGEAEELSIKGDVIQVERSGKDERWEQPWGENKSVINRYNELSVKIAVPEDMEATIRFRVFDDGVGFRYEIDASAGRGVSRCDSILVMEERSEFRLPEWESQAVTWSIPAHFDTYELDYRELPLHEVKSANTPFTFRTLSGLYGSIHEAALYDYPEMTLAGEHLTSLLAPWPDGVKARFEGDSFKTPWRTIQIGRKAVDLINSEMILNLNEPCMLHDTEWIEPLKYIGIWWGMHLGIETWKMGPRHGATTENALKYIDFAAEHDIDAVLFEGWNEGWESWGGMQNFDYTRPYPDFDIDSIITYAAGRGVRIIGHHETGGNIPNYEKGLERYYGWSAEKGMHHVKTGYAGGIPGGHSHHGQYAVRHYRRVVETAARHRIALDVHEPIKETGIRRTYPNMMTSEGAKGMEWNAWSSGNTPFHHLVIPFTRLLAGPMDYTPGIFDILLERGMNDPGREKWNDQDKGDSRVNSTVAAQIAAWILFYSPLQMASDLIENYEGNPAFRFFEDFDPDCDWSEALCGEPGEYLAVVRRAGERFFLGAMTSYQERELSVPLTFLPEGKEYRAVIYTDGEDAHWQSRPHSLSITEERVSSETLLEIRMAPGGGYAVTFLPMENRPE